MQNICDILNFAFRLANRQISGWKVRVYTDEKATFRKGACHLRERNSKF